MKGCSLSLSKKQHRKPQKKSEDTIWFLSKKVAAMKIKNKGKVFPSPSSSSSAPPPSTDRDFLAVLNLLPAAILVLVSDLAVEEREVLAYLMNSSMKNSAPSSVTPSKTKKKASKKALSGGGGGGGGVHAAPIFDCDCFDCYTTYWFRWDSSANRELIDKAIEAFEEQLNNGENPSKNAGKGKRRERIGRRSPEKPLDVPAASPEPEVLLPPINDVTPTASLNAEIVDAGDTEEQDMPVDASEELPPQASEDAAVIIPSPPASSHRGFGRKVWPDLMGIFNSRLWSLWGPN